MKKFEKIVKQTFKKSERLSGKKDIEELFNNGSYFYLSPLKILVNPGTSSQVHQVLFAVPKKNFKRAVDRNLLKRRMREAYRLHKHLLITEPNKLSIAYIYTSKEAASYQTIAKQIKESINRLNNYVEKSI
ncbi:MAG: ribonuclease P protein component [Cyclobacteriaceae bacterium]|nr:ribonuclease P protein component [Cyclobacteriaceae bacterium]